MIYLMRYFCEDCFYFKKSEEKPCEGRCLARNQLSWTGRPACESFKIKQN